MLSYIKCSTWHDSRIPLPRVHTKNKMSNKFVGIFIRKFMVVRSWKLHGYTCKVQQIHRSEHPLSWVWFSGSRPWNVDSHAIIYQEAIWKSEGAGQIHAPGGGQHQPHPCGAWSIHCTRVQLVLPEAPTPSHWLVVTDPGGEKWMYNLISSEQYGSSQSRALF